MFWHGILVRTCTSLELASFVIKNKSEECEIV